MTIQLLMLGDVAEMSPNRRMHYRERDRLRDKWKLLTIDEWNASGGEMFSGRVKISFRVFRSRMMDEGNLASSLSLKAIEDALKGRAYPDDSPRYVTRGSVTQEVDRRFSGCPAVEVILEEASG